MASSSGLELEEYYDETSTGVAITSTKPVSTPAATHESVIFSVGLLAVIVVAVLVSLVRALRNPKEVGLEMPLVILNDVREPCAFSDSDSDEGVV